MSRNEKTGTIPQPYMWDRTDVRYPLAKYSDEELGMHEEFCMYRGHRARSKAVFEEMTRRGFFGPPLPPLNPRSYGGALARFTRDPTPDNMVIMRGSDGRFFPLTEVDES